MKASLVTLQSLCAAGILAVIIWPADALHVLLFILAAAFLAALTIAGVQSHRLRGRHRRSPRWHISATNAYSALSRRYPSWSRK